MARGRYFSAILVAAACLLISSCGSPSEYSNGPLGDGAKLQSVGMCVPTPPNKAWVFTAMDLQNLSGRPLSVDRIELVGNVGLKTVAAEVIDADNSLNSTGGSATPWPVKAKPNDDGPDSDFVYNHFYTLPMLLPPVVNIGTEKFTYFVIVAVQAIKESGSARGIDVFYSQKGKRYVVHEPYSITLKVPPEDCSSWHMTS